MTVHADTLFWTNTYSGAIMALPTTGGTPTVFAPGQDAPMEIAVAGNSVYWINDDDGGPVPAGPIANSLMTAPLTGGPATVVAPDSPHALAAHGDRIYWTAYDANFQAVIMTLGTDGVTPTVLVTGPGFFPDITVADSGIYVMNVDAGIMRAPLEGGTATTLVAMPPDSYISGLAVDGDYVYWSTGEMEEIFSAPIGGGAGTKIFSGHGEVDRLVSDGTHLYCGSPGVGGIVRFDSGGGSPTILVGGQEYPWALAVDKDSVYWGSADQIVKLTPK